MIEQKNRMDPATTMHHLPEIMVDFELLWRVEGHIQNSENDSKVVHERSNTKIGILKKKSIV